MEGARGAITPPPLKKRSWFLHPSPPTLSGVSQSRDLYTLIWNYSMIYISAT